MRNFRFKKLFILSLVFLFSGCTMTKTAIEHHNLITETKISKNIFLEPVDSKYKKIYVSIKNMTDQPVDIAKRLKKAIQKHGYKIVNEPSQAHYLLQANILQFGKSNQAALKQILSSNYGEEIKDNFSKFATIDYLTHSHQDSKGADLIEAGSYLMNDTLTKNITYGLTTDLKILERIIPEQVSSQNNHGTKKKTNWQNYKTRIVASADKLNLTFAEALPVLETGLIKKISSIF